MININTEFLKEVTADQFWFLCHIVKRFNETYTCFPSNKTLCEDTNWDIKKLQKIKMELIEKGLLIANVRYKKNSQSSNEYRINTKHLSVYIEADRLPVVLQNEDTPIPFSDTPPTRKGRTPPTPKTDNEVLTSEVLASEVLVKAKKTIEEKKNEFKESIKPYLKQYDRDICNAFYAYWGEAAKGGKKLRWELEDTWEINLRLARWKKQDDEKKAKYAPSRQQQQPDPVYIPRALGTNSEEILKETDRILAERKARQANGG